MIDPHLTPNWASSALLTIDVQHDFLSGAPHGVPGTTELLPAMADLAAAFRRAGRPIVHIASERDYRLVLAEDAVSRLTSSGCDEIKGLGVTLASTEAIAAALDAERSTL
jgi:nicotinamidase-related amidase